MIKSDKLNRNDVLYGEESLVSPNCRFVLTMERNGNLILRGLVGKYEDPFEKDAFGRYTNNKNEMIFYQGWESNSTVRNLSELATSRLLLKDGTLIVQELQYPNVPSFGPINVWNSNEINTGQNELIFKLTNEGCLELAKYYDSYARSTPLWSVCAKLSRGIYDIQNSETPLITTTKTITTLFGTTDNNGGNSGDRFESENGIIDTQFLVRWNTIISIALGLLILLFLYFCIKQIYGDSRQAHLAMANPGLINSIATVSSMRGENLELIQEENTDIELDKAIELWSRESQFQI